MAGTDVAVDPPQPELQATLPLTSAQGRFGVDYFQLACTHAGFGCAEPRSGEDVQAIDAMVTFEYGPVLVQVKCTTRSFSKKLQTIRIPIEDGWRDSWQKLNVRSPIYFVVVKVPEQEKWVDYLAAHTHVAATAYWARIDPSTTAKSISVHQDNQLTRATLYEWARERQQALGSEAA